MIRYRALNLDPCLRMIFPENRYTLFRIMCEAPVALARGFSSLESGCRFACWDRDCIPS
jgi:hypothetical protein